jgi:hypothetical protein
MTARLLLLLSLALTTNIPLAAQKTATPPPRTLLSYADVADLALPAPIVAQLKIRKAERLKGELAGNVTATQRRYLVTADIAALIRGSGGLPPRITYVVDVAQDARGKWPKLEKAEVIVFALPVAGRPSEIRLTAPDAQQPASPALAMLVRNLLSESGSATAPPKIRGAGEAFHVDGTVQGEGETQIFLNAADGRPLSLSIWREPGAAARWAVSVGEIVDQGAEPPARDTLLWYRLACSLPARLPHSSVDSLTEADAAIAAEDYATVIAGLGPCRRTRER